MHLDPLERVAQTLRLQGARAAPIPPRTYAARDIGAAALPLGNPRVGAVGAGSLCLSLTGRSSSSLRMLRRVAAHVAPAAAEQPSWRRYDFGGGEEAPPSGTVWGRSIPASSWEGLSFADRVRHLEVEGFVVLPRQLPPALVQQLQGEVGRLDQSNSPDYSDKTFGAGELATQLVEGRLEAALTPLPAR
eukprot:COSAG04_NODE_10428_length_778_cov_1.279823_1_plen_188_part_01